MQLKSYQIFRFFFIVLSLICVFTPLLNADEREDFDKGNPGSLLSLNSSWVDSVMNDMTLREQIGQLFMVAAYSNQSPEHTQHIMRLIKKYHIGGLIFFQGDPNKQAKLTNIYQNYSKIPLMIGMDAEWGLGMRLDSVISYPRQMTLGAIRDDSLIYRMGGDIAKQLSRLGVHINFAPVVDVNINPRNPVIGSRSFGENRFNVANKGIAYMNGMQDNCVLAVAKHFPGHGDTHTDSHKTLPVIPFDSTRLDSIELYPFKRMIQHGVGGVMMAHLDIPAFTQDAGRPATLSGNVVTRLLREKLGFDGLIFTDALNMGGVTKSFPPGIIESQAIKAGNDVLLYPQDVSAAVAEIKKQVRRGSISRSSIEESCRRILSFKYWAGLDTISGFGHQNKLLELVDRNNLIEDLNKPQYKVLKGKLIENALTLLKNQSAIVPFKGLDTLQLATLAIGAVDTTPLQHTIDLYGHAKHYSYQTGDPTGKLIDTLGQCDAVVISMHHTNAIPVRRYGYHSEHLMLLNRIAAKTPVILIHFGNTYALKYIDDLDKFEVILNAYDDDSVTQAITGQALFGAFPMNGRLPVSINDSLTGGTGMETKACGRLRYALPEAAGVDGEKLTRIDSIVYAAIDSQATPGCQILVARKNRVIYHKAFGYHTYLKRQAVEWNDVYDVASITKIGSTLPALMKLFENDTIDLNATLDHYLPHLDTTNKGDLVLMDILTHQARLKSWIPFYLNTLESLCRGQGLLNNKFSQDYPYKLGKHSYMIKNFRYKQNIYSRFPSSDFSIQVAENLYIHNAYKDSIYRWIDESELLDQKDYVYSDLGYYYIQRIIEQITGVQLDKYIKQHFYDPLGAYLTGYRPLMRYHPEQIVPTENDMVFRRQLLQGYVHDPGTAMLGGVGGHAGIFSNANDLAKIMQLYLNGGSYGGQCYFSDSTIRLFTRSPFKEKNGNRRALGFDKPVSKKEKEGPTAKGVSMKSFGHSGFTGTIAWADPEEQVVYVFLSNRIHPDQDNLKLIQSDVRTRIQRVIYDAIMNEEMNISTDTNDQSGKN